MGGVKRKLSRATSSGRPAKLLRQATSSTVSTSRKDSLPRKPFAPVKLQSKKKSSSSEIDIPSLRRAATLPVQDPETPSDLKPVKEAMVSVRKLSSGAKVGLTAAYASTIKLTTKKTTLVFSDTLSKSAPIAAKTEPVSSVRKGSSYTIPNELGPTASSSKAGSLGKTVSIKKKTGSDVGPLSFADKDASADEEGAVHRIHSGGLVEIVISFDTTGSMSRCLDEVKGRVSELFERLQDDIPGIRIAVFAHGNYRSKSYVTSWLDFGSTLQELCDFIQHVGKSDRGDIDKCYELVLRQVHVNLSWTPGSQRSLIMMGDANPHPPNYHNKLNICWKEECKKLYQMGVRIYAIHVGKSSLSRDFYRGMASITSGRYLSIDQFPGIFEMIMAICYREGGIELLQTYEKEVRSRHDEVALNKDLDEVFNDLRGEGEEVPVVGHAKKVRKTENPKEGPPKKVKNKAVSKQTPATATNLSIKRKTKKPSARTASPVTKSKNHVKTIPAKVASPVTKSKRKKLASPSQKKTLAPKKKFRENVPNCEFLLNCMKIVWSKWEVGLQCSTDCKNNNIWEKRGGKKGGHRRRALFKKLNEDPALFEIGVQIVPKGKIYPVYLISKSYLRPKASLESQLLSKPYISQQVEEILSIKASIFFRRGLVVSHSQKTKVGGIENVEKLLLKHYDYAWCKNRTSKKRRTMRKNGVYISKKCL